MGSNMFFQRVLPVLLSLAARENADIKQWKYISLKLRALLLESISARVIGRLLVESITQHCFIFPTFEVN